MNSYDIWFNRKLQDIGDWKWSPNHVDAILVDLTSNKEVTLNLLTDIFSKLQISHLKKGNLEKLYDAGHKDFISIMNMDYTSLYMVLGEIGVKVDDSFRQRLDGIYWPELVGSLNLFGRGIGRKTLTKLYNECQGDLTLFSDPVFISSVEGFDLKTATPISENVEYVIQQLSLIDNDYLRISVYEPGSGPIGERMLGQNVVFTGIRDPELEKQIIEQGGIVGTGVSSKTTIVCAKDPTSASGKLKKARQINMQCVADGLSPSVKLLNLKELQKMLL